MPQLSPRITGINAGGSDGWEIFYRGRDMAARGEPVIELTIGEHDIGTDDAILDAMHRSARGGHTGYASVPGTASLRDAVAARISQSSGIATTRDNILITAGGQAGLYAAHVACCPNDGTALFVDPYYATYPGTLRAAGARAVAVPTRAQAGFLPDAQTLRDAIRSTGAHSLLINSPNNPTGAVYPRETMEHIAKVVRDEDIWLISDEVYDGQVWDGVHVSPRVLPGMQDRTLVIGSMSKSHAMTGSRIGWIAGPPAAIEALTDLATNTTYGVPGYIQDAALFALGQGPEAEDAVAAPFRRRRNLAVDILSRQSLLTCLPPQGAMYVMLSVQQTGLSGDAFAEALLDAERIAVMPGESFGASAAGHVRVALTRPDAELKDALLRICAFAAACAKAA